MPSRPRSGYQRLPTDGPDPALTDHENLEPFNESPDPSNSVKIKRGLQERQYVLLPQNATASD
jgi:hypothetical protein